MSYESSSQEKSLDEIEVKITQRGSNRAPLPDKPSQITQVLPPKPQIPTKPTCSFIKPVIKGKLKPFFEVKNMQLGSKKSSQRSRKKHAKI